MSSRAEDQLVRAQDGPVGWVLLSREAVARAEEALAANDRGVRDEVGFLALHQGFADRFFPGTSVLHTRLRYVLFVPWLMEMVATRDGTDFAARFSASETVLAGQLLRQEDREGVIGGRVWPRSAAQPPSMAYWTALGTWRILRARPDGSAPSRAETLRLMARQSRRRTRERDDEDVALEDGVGPAFVKLPKRPDELGAADRSLDFGLGSNEREFLRRHLLGVRRYGSKELSLLARLVDAGVGHDVPDLWASEISDVADDRDRDALVIARRASALAGIGRAVYAALLEIAHAEDELSESVVHRERLVELVEVEGRETHALDLVALERLLPRLRPDLVIFDEFQRFRDFLTEPEAEAGSCPPRALDAAALRVLTAIRGEAAGQRTPLLLLSATPYSPFRGRGADSSYGDTAGDFFEVVKFLNGGGPAGREAAARARKLFAVVEEELRKGVPLSERSERARSELTALLTQVLSRTERPRSSGDTAADSGGGEREVRLLPADLSVFRHLKDSLHPNDYGWAVALWQSVPLPMQGLGRRYKVWRRAANVRAESGISLTNDMRTRFGTNGPWAHPGLRALLEVMPVRRLALPWTAPSLPWWPLGGDWKSRGGNQSIDGKLLVFSRFRAVPPAVSGLVSYTVEAWLQRRVAEKRRTTYDGVMRRQFLAAAPKRPSLLGLFHPSPLLASVDPTARGLGSLRTAKSAVRAQLRQLLAGQGIRMVPRTSRARRRPWELLAAIEHGAELWPASRAAWNAVATSLGARSGIAAGRRLLSVVRQWEEKASAQVSEVDQREFEALCNLALEAPGVVLARALRRHWKEALAPENLCLIAGLSWRGLRSYLDEPWFAAALDGPERSYPDRIRRAVVQGNLESVLDEHFWYLGVAAGTDWKEAVAELESSLRLRTSTVLLHERGPDSGTMRLRCHAAVALNEARAEGRARRSFQWEEAQESPLRPDEVRRAFNGPFWPHVLVKTSIGQEGLDFHPWCKALAHWDLCSGPVALEQREGRISRFAGLSVRRAIAARLSSGAIHSNVGDSPWDRLAARADAELADDAGLEPWWVAPGSTTQRIVFAVPGSEKPAHLARLNRERAFYRLVLGMPDQEDLLELIATGEAWDSDTVRRACLDLSAWGGLHG